VAKQGIRSEAEIEALLAGYEASGQTRKEYCQAVGLAVTTLDYYRARQSRREREGAKRRTGMVRVTVARAAKTQGTPMLLEAGGRRLQWIWDGDEENLAGVLRAMERA